MKSKLFLIYILFLVPIWCQISPTTLTFSSVLKQYPPYSQAITVTGSVASPTVTGCTDTIGTGICSSIHNRLFNNLIQVSWPDANLFSNMALGVHQATFTITLAGGTCSGGCTETINYTIVSPITTTWQTYQNSGAAFGCSVSDPIFQHPENCDIVNGMPGGLALLPKIPGVAGQIFDGNFFGPRYRTSPSNDITVINADGTGSAINANKTFVSVSSLFLHSGTAYMEKTDGTGDILASFLGSTTQSTWDPVQDIQWYSKTDGTFHFITIPGFVDTKATFNYVGNAFSNWGCSEDCSIVAGRYWPLLNNQFVTGNDPVMIIYDIQTGNYYPFNYSGITSFAVTTPRPTNNSIRGITGCSKGFSYTGKMWCEIDSRGDSGIAGSNYFVSWKGPGNSIVGEGPQGVDPESSENGAGFYGQQAINASDCAFNSGHASCRSTPHGDWVEATIGGNKHEFWVFPSGTNGSGINYNFVQLIDPDAGPANSEIPVQVGGGGYFLFPLDHNAQDYHVNCAQTAPICLITVDNGSGFPSIQGYPIRNVTIANPGVFTANMDGGGHVSPVGGKIIMSPLPLASVTGAYLDANNKCTVNNFTALTGTVSLASTTITLTSGPPFFDSQLVTHLIYINGTTSIQVTGFTDTTHVTYNGSLGTLTGVSADWGSRWDCGVATGGSYTANAGVAVADVTPTKFPNQSSMFLLDLTNLGDCTNPNNISTCQPKVTQLLKTRAWRIFNDPTTSNGYYISQTSISPDGTFWCGHSNDGVPANNAMFCGSTGFSPTLIPFLNISKTPNGVFRQGQTASFTSIVTNNGTGNTDGTTVTVTDNLPSGLTLVSMTGTGWTCVSNSCTRHDVLSSAAASYNPITINVKATVNATSPQVNSIQVSGGGSVTNTTNTSVVIQTGLPGQGGSLMFGHNKINGNTTLN